MLSDRPGVDKESARWSGQILFVVYLSSNEMFGTNFRFVLFQLIFYQRFKAFTCANVANAFVFGFERQTVVSNQAISCGWISLVGSISFFFVISMIRALDLGVEGAGSDSHH